MKHPHYDVIVAWADGATIEYFNTLEEQWQRLDGSDFYPQLKYRVKPAEKVVRWLWAYLSVVKGRWATNRDYMTDGEARDYFGIYKQTYKKLEWSREEFDE